MDKEKPSWKDLRIALSIPIVVMAIGFMYLSFEIASMSTFSVDARMFARLQAIHNMLISIGFFLLAILIRVW